MIYTLNSKNIRIPDSDIERTQTALKISQSEAIQIWLEDEGYLVNKDQEELEQKAKKNHITTTIHKAKSNRTKRQTTPKQDPDKEKIISELANYLKTLNYSNINITNKTKIIQFTIGGENYELNLIRHRKKQNN